MTLSHQLRLAILLLVLGCAAGCDQASKHVARNKLGERGCIMMPGGFGEFRLAENPGSFLSFGDALPRPWRFTLFTLGTGVGLAALLAYLVFGRQFSRLLFAGLGLVWAGGVCNLLDRIMRHGLVSDFIYLHLGQFQTGIFNVADVIIMLGGAVIACDLWLQHRFHAGKPCQSANHQDRSK